MRAGGQEGRETSTTSTAGVGRRAKELKQEAPRAIHACWPSLCKNLSLEGHPGLLVIAVTAMTRYRTDRRPSGPSETSPAFEGQSNRPIGPIEAVLGPCAAYLSPNPDRRSSDHQEDAADRSQSVRGDRRVNGRNRRTAERQRGLSVSVPQAVDGFWGYGEWISLYWPSWEEAPERRGLVPAFR